MEDVRELLINDEFMTRLMDRLERSEDRVKRIDLAALVAIRERYRGWGRSVVWTNGCFDLIHAGHVRSLQAARDLGDLLVVGINSDDSVKRFKGPGRPLVSQEDRALVLASLACVDYVVVFGEDDPSVVIARLRPDVVCKGEDYATSAKPMPERAVVEGYGGRVVFLPLLAGLSTTELIRRIKAMNG